MRISEGLNLLKTQRIFRRTVKGRSITDFAMDIIEATVEDNKNYESDLTQCLNCGFIASSLLFADGCGNCGSKDLTQQIKEIK